MILIPINLILTTLLWKYYENKEVLTEDDILIIKLNIFGLSILVVSLLSQLFISL